MGEVVEIRCLPRVSSSPSQVVPTDDDDEVGATQQQLQRAAPLGLLLQYSRRETSEDHVWLPNNLDIITTIYMPEKLDFGESNIIHKELELERQSEDEWLPITQSRNGNAFTAALHLLCSGLHFQALLLPVAFISLGWIWGTLCLSLVFVWQLYTTWLLVHLHEPKSPGPRYSRYVVLSIIAFGPKLGKLLAIFPTMYLSGGACVLIVITGGGIMELLSKLVCEDGPQCNAETVLTGAEWFLVFLFLAILVSQFFPSLNSLSPVSLIGSVAAVAYFTMLWTLSISKGRPVDVSYEPSQVATSELASIRGIINGIGIIALTFKGHNLVLEIQGTMPTDPHHPSRHRMWKGVTASYVVIAVCLFPLAIGGYWAYGNMMPADGILSALSMFHLKGKTSSKSIMGTIYVIMLVHLFSSFQIYGMPVFDNLERIYINRKNQACPRWLRSAIRVFFGGLAYFIAVAFPFLGSLGPFIGAITLPLSLAYPCFMWIAIKKPKFMSFMWCLNFGLGCIGTVTSLLLAAAALWNLVANGLDANFFNPH